ncbi:unnamed protein product [Moneuplotes crassus]|uniref:Uncharacterized protein n=1 Tax=Euplotes crassus TaxID=5936 RepID=A0AAD1YAA7_EUPCR|nr:unnamed protein product [Moneuplotes crassus]
MDEDSQSVYSIREPTEKITLHISCRKLANLNIITVSDPVCHIYVASIERPNDWKLFGKIEQI